MKAFVSYARKDEDQVRVLQRDLEELCAVPPWIDRVLAGGQPWWDEILRQIRSTDVFVLAASRSSLASSACLTELEYALAVQRPVLPVMVGALDLSTAPDAVRQTQVIDYRERTADAAIQLARAVMRLPVDVPLPTELPAPPPMPESYAQPYRKQLAAKSLDLTQQAQLFAALKIHANVEEDRDEAIELIEQLRDRQDVTAAVLREVEEFLTIQRLAPQAPARAPAAQRTDADMPPPAPAGKDSPPQAPSKPAKRPRAEPLQLPFDDVVDLVKPFAAPDLYVFPDIPNDVAKKARTTVEVPKGERIAAVLNLAWFSAGSNALVVTDRALHHRKLGVAAHIPFDELADATIGIEGTTVKVGGERQLSIGNTAAGMPKIESMMKALSSACGRARRAAD